MASRERAIAGRAVMLSASALPAAPPLCAWNERLTGDRGNAFDAVRLLLATLVVLEHSYFLIDGNSRADPLSQLSGAQTNFGHFAVSLRAGGTWWALLICGTYAILYFCLTRSAEITIGGRRTDLSYGVYFYGWAVQQLLLFYAGPHLSPISLFAAATLVTSLVAWASWTLVEKPSLDLVRIPRRTRGSVEAIKA